MTRAEGIKELTDHYLDLYSYAFSVLKNKADAEDAVQESLATTLSYPMLRNPYGFCVRVLQRRCVDLLRNKGTQQELKEIADLGQNEPSEMAKRVAQLVKKLPKETQRLLVMHDVEELSSREIAEKLGMTTSNVKKIIGKAHKKLRKQLS